MSDIKINIEENPFEFNITETGPKGDTGAAGSDGADGNDGADGASSYTYVAYASDDQGTGFSLTPSDSLDYIAVKSTDTEIPSPSAGDFSGLWVKYHGDEGEINPDNYSAKDSLHDNDKITGFDSEDSDNPVTWLWSVIKSTFKSYYDSVTSTLTNKTLTSPAETVQALGSISGSVEIDVSQGSKVTATITGTTTLTFTDPGKEIPFVLVFSQSSPQTLNWPANTIFGKGETPDPQGSLYEIPCSIDSSGTVTVHGIIDEYATV